VEWSPWWSWQGGYLFEAVLALLSLALVLSIDAAPDLDRDSPPGPVEPLGYLPVAVVAALSVWYVMHWGQLHGWLEGPDITAAIILGSVALCGLLWIVWPSLDPGTLRDGLPRLGLITYGGFVQYFNSRGARTRPARLAETVARLRWRGARITCPGRRNGPLTLEHNELAVLEPAQHCRVQLVRRPPALAARPGAVLDGLRQRDGAAGDDDLH
jgi:hypothetical protein